MDTHHVGMKIQIHPDKRVEVEMHHMPGGSDASGHQGMPGGQNPAAGPMPVSPQPGTGANNVPSWNKGAGHVPDPMADGAKNAVDAAFAGPHSPIARPDGKRAGSEQKDSKKVPDKNVSKKPASNKAPVGKTPAKAGKGKAPKNVE